MAVEMAGWMDGWMDGWVEECKYRKGHNCSALFSTVSSFPVPFLASSGFLFPVCIFILCCLQNQIPGYLCSSFKE